MEADFFFKASLHETIHLFYTENPKGKFTVRWDGVSIHVTCTDF